MEKTHYQFFDPSHNFMLYISVKVKTYWLTSFNFVFICSIFQHKLPKKDTIYYQWVHVSL